MSHIYIKEPPTAGKVLVKTTLGDLDVELWAKETPLACRNFVQLCMEGYYDGTIFHRVVRDFIAQGGDPTGTGEGGESIYGHPFKDEFHSRLKFMRRGLVAMANGGPNDNGSQFFFTLGRADELNNKHTLFGKLTGDTLYNMLRFNDIPTDKEDRPLDPAPKIIRTEVLSNPFDDIVPRVDKRKLDRKGEGKPKSQSKATKNFSLLSFGEEAEEDEEETMVVSKALKIKSSHDVLTEDPKLSSQPAVVETSTESRDGEHKRRNEKQDDGGDSGEAEFDTRMRDQVRKRKRQPRGEQEGGEEEEMKLSRKEELHLEARKLRRELRTAKRQKEREEDEKAQQVKNELESLPEPVRALRKEQELYKSKQKVLGKGGNREQQTLEMLTKFKSRLFTAREGAGDGEGKEGDREGMEEGEREGMEEDMTDEKEDANWLSHRLTFSEERWAVSKDASMQNEDTFDIYDPRNPINKRRREDGKQQQRQKHRRDRTHT